MSYDSGADLCSIITAVDAPMIQNVLSCMHGFMSN